MYLFNETGISFGSGNDILNIAAGGTLYTGKQIDFGTGYDTLNIDGVLACMNYGKFISGVEKITGSGTVAINLYDEHDADWVEDILEGSDVEIVNNLGLTGFKGRTEELGDNKISGAAVMELNSKKVGADEIDFWLCGAKKAASVDHGFADAVDYVKYVKNSGDEDLVFRQTSYADLDNLTCEVFDSSGKKLTGSKYSMAMAGYELEADVTSWNNGTYYLKLSTASNKAFSGEIEIDD